MKKWAKREGLEAYRIYDRDIPEYPYSIDLYGKALVVSAWARHGREEELAEQEDQQLRQKLADLFTLETQDIYLKVRRKQKDKAQYEKLSNSSVTRAIGERGLQFEINLTDYLDTGLFLDHRATRLKIKELAAGKNFLNLFCYTGTASVYAAAGGATSTTSVDLSQTYLNWAVRNFQLNRLSLDNHRFIKADILSFLQAPEVKQDSYDLIFVDPPSFSNSKSTETVFSVQKDFVKLLKLCGEILSPEGTLLFSNNLRTFKMDQEQLKGFKIEEWTEQTLPKDFRNKKIHRSWRLAHSDR